MNERAVINHHLYMILVLIDSVHAITKRFQLIDFNYVAYAGLVAGPFALKRVKGPTFVCGTTGMTTFSDMNRTQPGRKSIMPRLCKRT